MGFWDFLKAAREYTKAGLESTPKWGRIVSIGGKLGPIVNLEVEIHYGLGEPRMASLATIPPKGLELRVGQDVHISWVRSEYTGDQFTIDWNRPPQYGRELPAAPDPSKPAIPPRLHPVQRLAQLRRDLTAGKITQAEFDRARLEIMDEMQ